jgi:hypothetical protein
MTDNVHAFQPGDFGVALPFLVQTGGYMKSELTWQESGSIG